MYHIMKTQSPILCQQNEQQKMIDQLQGRQSGFQLVLTKQCQHKVRGLNDISTQGAGIPSSVCVWSNAGVGRVGRACLLADRKIESGSSTKLSGRLRGCCVAARDARDLVVTFRGGCVRVRRRRRGMKTFVTRHKCL